MHDTGCTMQDAGYVNGMRFSAMSGSIFKGSR